jgi:hypothetical protein
MANVELPLARDGEVGSRSGRKVRSVLGIGSLARRPSLEVGVGSVESDGDEAEACDDSSTLGGGMVALSFPERFLKRRWKMETLVDHPPKSGRGKSYHFS